MPNCQELECQKCKKHSTHYNSKIETNKCKCPYCNNNIEIPTEIVDKIKKLNKGYGMSM